MCVGPTRPWDPPCPSVSHLARVAPHACTCMPTPTADKESLVDPANPDPELEKASNGKKKSVKKKSASNLPKKEKPVAAEKIGKTASSGVNSPHPIHKIT